MRAGLLKHIITLKSPIITRDDTGHTRETGSTAVLTTWANVEALGLKQTKGQDQSQSIGQLRITTRYMATITTAHRIEWEDAEYNVEQVIQDPNKRETVVIVTGG